MMFIIKGNGKSILKIFIFFYFVIQGTSVKALQEQDTHVFNSLTKNLHIDCFHYDQFSVNIHLATINLNCPGLAIVVNLQPDNRQTVSEFAKSNNLTLAINGDYPRYSLNINNGKVLASSKDRVDRGFIACNRNYECLVDKKNSLTFVDSDWKFAIGGWQVLTNGQFTCEGETRCKESYSDIRHPRTAVGLSRKKRELYFIVVEGRHQDYDGMTLKELAQLFHRLDITEGINLDGGGSSTMVIDHTRVSRLPASQFFERAVVGHIGIRVDR
jgi:exopolysaccharide biosynthesis protein